MPACAEWPAKQLAAGSETENARHYAGLRFGKYGERSFTGGGLTVQILPGIKTVEYSLMD